MRRPKEWQWASKLQASASVGSGWTWFSGAPDSTTDVMHDRVGRGQIQSNVAGFKLIETKSRESRSLTWRPSPDRIAFEYLTPRLMCTG